MTGKISHNFILLIISLLLSITINAQTISELESMVNKLQSEIKTSQNLLKKTGKNKQATLNEIELLQTQIKKRDDLIKTYEKQITIINNQIKAYKKDINTLQNELKKSREEYADILSIRYKTRNSLNNLLFIFSSDDFNQAVRRMRYIKQIKELLEDKMTEIEDTKKEIKQRIEKNEEDKKHIERLKNTQDKEKEALNAEKKQLNDKIVELKKREADIKKDIAKKQKEATALQDKIKKIIEEEVARNKKNSAADVQLSNKFEGNIGKLPWPVEKGVITKKYGKSQHPTQPKVVIFNNGIDITTDEGAAALCVFDGQVSTVFSTGTENVVMVRHGMYFTLYANIDKVFVKAGDKVKTGQKIGIIHTSATDNTTTLHFELWNEKNNVNPEKWLR
ncbi:MAG: murein hydrolase activator EnvC family protein [Candidatus Limimorpha sp.]